MLSPTSAGAKTVTHDPFASSSDDPFASSQPADSTNPFGDDLLGGDFTAGRTETKTETEITISMASNDGEQQQALEAQFDDLMGGFGNVSNGEVEQTTMTTTEIYSNEETSSQVSNVRMQPSLLTRFPLLQALDVEVVSFEVCFFLYSLSFSSIFFFYDIFYFCNFKFAFNCRSLCSFASYHYQTFTVGALSMILVCQVPL